LKILQKVVVSVLLLWVIFLLTYYGNVLLNQNEVEKNTASFLKAVQARNISVAPDFFGSSLDIENVRKSLREDGFRLLSNDYVKADYDDGCVCTGHVDLTFEVDGKPLKVSAIFTVGPGNKPYQICVLTPSGIESGSISELSKWNLHACGGGDF
jgi:hypothetical protein